MPQLSLQLLTSWEISRHIGRAWELLKKVINPIRATKANLRVEKCILVSILME